MQRSGSKHFASCPPSRPWGRGHKIKIHFFQNMVMLYIKLNGTTIAAT